MADGIRRPAIRALEGEVFFRHVQQRISAGKHGFHVATGTRQQALEVEPRGQDLGRVDARIDLGEAALRAVKALFSNGIEYLLVGAAVVIPIYGIIYLSKVLRRRP